MNNAKILGIDKTVGTLEVGRDATFFISKGDALDMIGLAVQKAYIQVRDINLDTCISNCTGNLPGSMGEGEFVAQILS